MAHLFSDTAHTAMSVAKEEAERFGQESIGTEHLLLGLLEAGGLATRVLMALGIDPNEVRVELDRLLTSQAKNSGKVTLSPSPIAKRMIDNALEEARNRGQERVDTEHLLLSLLNETEGGALKVLKHLRVDIDLLRTRLIHRLDSKSMG